jgi:hypothetical protein
MGKAVKAISVYITMCIIAALAGLSLAAIFGGCIPAKSTPDIVLPDKPALEGNAHTSGLLYQIRDGGFVISRQLRDQYLKLHKTYYTHLGKKKSEGDQALTEVYIITDEGMMNLLKMKTWEKNPWLIEELKNQ